MTSHDPAENGRAGATRVPVSWLGAASCLVAVVTTAVLLRISDVDLDFHWNAEGYGFGFTINTPLETPVRVAVSAVILSGLALAAAALARRPRELVTPVVGLLLNLALAVAFGYMLYMELVYGASPS